jgi:phenylpropionate dioxygenase-like ring-hydroxylating dioxygenase large terminal subunit
MLKPDDNELLTRVGPGTPMGRMLREYWMPALRSDALVADGAPARVRLVGENFVAFRGSSGKVGFLYEACPHRGASMVLGRNEENSLRCIFHGWQIDVNGKLLDVPCEPANRREAFKAGVTVKHFSTREAGGLVWVYLGKEAQPPAFPEFEFNTLPASHVCARRAIVHYNWLQGLEAHLDASHVGILHSGFLDSKKPLAIGIRDLSLATMHRAPRTEMHPTPYGLREGALRELDDGTTYARIREVALPFFTFIPHAAHEPCSGRATVPIDDEWDAEWYILYDPHKPLSQRAIDMLWEGADPDADNFAASLGTAANNWHQDREAMKRHWSGFPRSIPFEDFIITESMGPRVDRSVEQLGQADIILVQVRRLLLNAVNAFQQGQPLHFNVDAETYRGIRAIAATIPTERDWREVDPVRERIALSAAE